MKKKLAALLALCMLSVTMTACGGGNAPAETTTASETTTAAETTTASETTTAAETTTALETTNAEPDTNDTPDDSSDFTLLDVSTDMIEVGVYAIDENNNELVFSMFTEPSGTPMASMFVYCPDGSGDVICGPYTSETETDEDGITWTLLTVTDVYTEQVFEIGFAETEDDKVYIMNSAGSVYDGQYLSADDTIVYMGTAVAMLSDDTSNDTSDDTSDTSESGEFTLLDVTADMIDVGVYAIDEDNNELVFSMFTEPSGTPMASMFVYCPDGSGDVICGPYTSETETDEDGITWTLLTVTDVYTEQVFEIGFAETEDDKVYIMNSAGSVYDGQYLTADDTVVYMGTAVGLLS